MICKINRAVINSLLIPVALLFSCKTSQEAFLSGDDRKTEPELLNNSTYFLTEFAGDSNYGISKENPIKVGGIKENEGPMNEKRFLNALLSESGNELNYFRTGSCCAFKTKNGLIGDTGLLDVYKIYEQGTTDTILLYFNMYDKGDLYIPFGFKAKEQ